MRYLGQASPDVLPPPPAPRQPSVMMLLGWGAIVAAAAGIFYAVTNEGSAPVRRNRRRRVSRNATRRKSGSKPKAPPFSDLGVLAAVGVVRAEASREAKGMLPPGVASRLSKMPPGIYKLGYGPKKGEVLQRFTSAKNLRNMLTSTRIGAKASGEFHWVIDAFDPSRPVVIRGIDGSGKTVFRVEEYARQLVREPVAVVRSRSKSR